MAQETSIGLVKEPVEQTEKEDEEEYVLLDLEDVFHGAGLPANCPYTLSGLDTVNPILSLGEGGLKLIGEYEESVGTCLVFTENEGSTLKEPNKSSGGTINELCKLDKRLKFRIMDTQEKGLQ